ncbi:cardiolipin synthase [Microlunatus lacustris]
MEETWDQLTGAGVVTGLLTFLVVVALLLAPRDRRPSSALAWILLISFLPVIGLVLFALIGSPKLPRSRREKQQSMTELITERSRDLEQLGPVPGLPAWLPSVARLNRSVGAMPMLEDNDAHLLTTFEQQLDALIAAVRGARRYVHVEFYILSLDDTTAPFFEALAEAVQRGVTVRVLMDHLGSRKGPGYRRTRKALDRMGASWRLMLPVQPYRGRYQRPDLRNHRKLLVADGEIGFVGSLNLIDPGYGKRANRRRGLRWHDVLAEVRGPVVHEIDALFVTDWYSETEVLLTSSQEQAGEEQHTGELLAQVAPSGPAFPTENNLALFNSLMYHAERRISITSPYFVPDESLLAAITTAARRGVRVELFVGEIGDQFFVFHAQHSYYAELLAAGVRIYLYPKPSILHAKHISVDDDVAVVGSSNMDIRSFQLDLELMLMVCGRSFVDEMRAVEDGYRRVSRELTAEEWGRRWDLHRVVDDLTRLTSAVQ